MEATKFPGKSGDLSVVIYPGDNKILIAMSLCDLAQIRWQAGANPAEPDRLHGRRQQPDYRRDPRMDRFRQGAVPEIPLDRRAARRF